MIAEVALMIRWKILYPKGGRFEDQYIMPEDWKCSCKKDVCDCYSQDQILFFCLHDQIKLGHHFVKLHNKNL